MRVRSWWMVVQSFVVLGVAACGGDDLVLPEEGVPTRIAVVSGNDQTGTVGAQLADSLVVRVTDAQGRPVQGQQVTFTIGAGGGSVSPGSASTDGNGLAATSWTLGPGAGAQLVTAKPVGNGAPDNIQAVFSASAGASNATALELVAGDNQSGTAGTALADSLVVRAVDGNGNPVAGVSVTWSVTGGGTVSAPSVVTGGDGRAAVRRTLGATAGPQSTTASADGLTGSPIVFSATATVGAAGRLSIARQPSTTASSGTPFATQPQVQLQDGNGNPVSTASIAVTAQISSGPAGAALSGTSTVPTNGSGLATFGNLGLTGPAGSYTINFVVLNRTDISGTPPTNTITLAAGSPARLAFQAQPTSTAAGATISPAVRVRVEDALGNLVTSASNSITIALGSNPGAGTLSGTRTVPAASGVATFSSLSIDRAGSGYTLVASASGLSGATSNPFNISTGAAAAISANSATTLSAVAGTAVSPAPSVKVTDGAGNAVAGVSVTFAVTAGGGSVSGATQTTDAQGIATVGSWILGTAAGSANNQLRATSSGLSGSPVTFTASATAGSAGSLVFVTQPAGTGQSGVALSPQPSLQLVDVNGNPVASGGVSVTAAIASGPGGALSGGSVNTNAQGVASFSGLTITGPSGTYSLVFSGTNLTGVTSGDIVIGSGSATKLGLTTPPSTNVVNGQNFPQQPVVQLQDASGNPVGTAGVTVTATVQSCSGKSLGGDVSVQTNSNGEAVFSDLRLTGSTGSCTLLFASSGLASVSSGIISVAPGPVSAASSSIAVDQGAITAGGAGTTVTITARDASSNVISGLLVEPSVSGGTGSFTPTSTTTNASGVATFTFTSTEAGTRTLGAVVDGVTLNSTVNVTVNAAAADAASSVLDVTPTTITAGGAGATATVTARDQYGNPVSGAAVTLGVTGSGNTVSPSSGSTNASGVFSATITSTEAGIKTVSATVAGASVPGTVMLTVQAAAPSAATSSVEVTPTSQDVGSGVTVTVTSRDAAGNSAGGTVSLASSLAGVFTDPSPTLDGTGVASTTFTPSEAGSHTITATLTNSAGTIDETTTLTANALPVSGATSSVSLAPSSITAGGSGSTVTVTARDATSATVAGASVTLGVSGSGNTISPSPTVAADASGIATFTVTSTVAEGKTVSATIDATPVTDTEILTVMAGAASASTSSLALGSSTATTGEAVTVTATILDEFSNPVPDASVTFATSGIGTFSVNPATTSASGEAGTSFTPVSVEAHTITASVGTELASEVLDVSAAVVNADLGSIEAHRPRVAGQTTTLTVTVREGVGKLLQGVTVTTAENNGTGTVTQPAAAIDGSRQDTGGFPAVWPASYTVKATADGAPITSGAVVQVL